MLPTAKRLHALGFAIHWIRPKSKMPVKSKWTTGPRDSWETLKREYKAGYNVGVRLGKASALADGTFLAVIDCDVKSSDHLSAMKAKLKGLGLTDTVQVASGRGNGSCHFYVRTQKPVSFTRLGQAPEKVKVKMPSAKPSDFERKTMTASELEAGWRKRAAWEISIMGEGQQVVLPPSIHPDSGRPYKWTWPLDDKWDVAALMKFNSAAHEGLHRDKELIRDFKPVSVDLISSALPDTIVDQILKGDGVEDRSAALYGASIAMTKAGFNQQQILTVLTDPDNFLGGVAFEHAKTKSRARAAQWILNYTIKKAKAKATSADDFDDVSDEEEPARLDPVAAKVQAAELLVPDDWRKLIERNIQDGGRPKSTLKNIKLIMTETMESQVFLAHNEFSVDDLWLMDTPWGAHRDRTVTDKDAIRIKEWFANKWRFEPSVEKINEALILIAAQNPFHPVREHLATLEWDGVPRLDDWLKNYLNAEGPKNYLRAVGSKTLIAMVKRIFEPGCKFDQVLILEGEQGVGKSTTARILSDPWFSDSFLNIADKDAVMNMQGVWVYELGELSAMSRADTNNLKEFISRSTDRIRPPYGRRTLAYPRQSIFIGTTNSDDYLKDRTGNRRFWPVRVGRVKMSALRKVRDQLLAEAVQAYRMGETTWIEDEELLQVVNLEQSKRVEHDELQDQLGEFLAKAENSKAKNWSPQFRISDLYEKAECMAGMRTDRSTQTRVAGSLRLLGYTKRRCRIKGINAQWWEKA